MFTDSFYVQIRRKCHITVIFFFFFHDRNGARIDGRGETIGYILNQLHEAADLLLLSYIYIGSLSHGAIVEFECG